MIEALVALLAIVGAGTGAGGFGTPSPAANDRLSPSEQPPQFNTGQ